MHDVPPEMTAIEITEPGGPEVLRATRRAVPDPAGGEVLIQVEAAGVKQTRGRSSLAAGSLPLSTVRLR
jgi:NADPH:quinone reductase